MTRIVAGYQHACVIAAAGAIWCWGNNAFGQLGYDLPTPIRNATPMTVLRGL